MTEAVLLDVQNVRRTFPRGGGEELLVLDDVNLTFSRARSSACWAVRARANRPCCG